MCVRFSLAIMNIMDFLFIVYDRGKCFKNKKTTNPSFTLKGCFCRFNPGGDAQLMLDGLNFFEKSIKFGRDKQVIY